MTMHVHRLTKSFQITNGCSSDQPGKGLALLSLGTSRSIYAEDHRQQILAEIDASIAWDRTWTGTPNDVNEPARDILALEDLLKLVEGAIVGE